MTGKEIVSQWRSYGMVSNAVSFGSMVATIDAALAAERGKMRERCAKEVEITGTSWGGKDWNNAITACAKAIRALEVT